MEISLFDKLVTYDLLKIRRELIISKFSGPVCFFLPWNFQGSSSHLPPRPTVNQDLLIFISGCAANRCPNNPFHFLWRKHYKGNIHRKICFLKKCWSKFFLYFDSSVLSEEENRNGAGNPLKQKNVHSLYSKSTYYKEKIRF